MLGWQSWFDRQTAVKIRSYRCMADCRFCNEKQRGKGKQMNQTKQIKEIKPVLSKRIIALLIALIMVVTAMPLWAQASEAQTTPAAKETLAPAQESVMEVSPWAYNILIEGENYGIFPQTWYSDMFQKPASAESIAILMKATEAKLSEMGVAKRTDFKALTFKVVGVKGLTRGAMVEQLYNIMAIYDGETGVSPVDYMTKRGILKGSGRGLDLELPCTSEQAVAMSVRGIQYLFENFNAGSKGLAWKVSNKGNTVYLLGSIHLAETKIYPINQSLLKAFESSDQLLVEADVLNSQNEEASLAMLMFQDKTRLKDVISTMLYNDVLKVFEKYDMSADDYTQFKPWALALKFSGMAMISSNSNAVQETAQAADHGIDVYFLLNAMLSGKPVVELEDMAYQASLFEGLSKDFQEKHLSASVTQLLNPTGTTATDSQALFKEYLKHWSAGDKVNFKKSFLSSFTEEAGGSDELSKMRFGKRDQDMTDKVVKLLESPDKKTSFMVVGSGHFIQEQSILDLLKAKGYTVENFYK